MQCDNSEWPIYLPKQKCQVSANSGVAKDGSTQVLVSQKGNRMNFDATSSDPFEYVNCLVCEQEIRRGKWSSRIGIGNKRVAFCSIWCTEAFQQNQNQYLARFEDDLATAS